MKLKQWVLAAGLAVAAASASATVVIEDWGSLGTSPSVAKVDVGTTKPFDNVYSFQLGTLSDLDAYASSFEDRSTGISGGLVKLFQGSYTDLSHAVAKGSFTFGVGEEVTFNGLGPGAYFYELTGIGIKAGGSYDFESFATPVPEPGTVALLLGGLGMLGFVARRRKDR